MTTSLDSLVYRLKASVPAVYPLLALGNAAAVRVLYGARLQAVLGLAVVNGTVAGAPGQMRPIGPKDFVALMHLVRQMPEEHLRFFHPHGLTPRALARVLRSVSILTYGLFRADELVAYAILKLFATRRAYLGRLVAPALAGGGIGRFLSRYLYWQGHELGFELYSTIHHDNLASLRSHAAVRPYTVVRELPNGFMMIRYTTLPSDAEPPELNIGEAPAAGVAERGASGNRE